MVDNHDLLKCPLCEGHGEVRRSHLLECVQNRTLENSLEGSPTRADDPTEDRSEMEEVGAGNRGQRDFQKDVHSWNPQLSMWRRSPKE